MAAENGTAPTGREPWSRRRTMKITVQDDTYKDVENLSMVVKDCGSSDGSNDIDSCHSKSRTFTVLVEADDTIAAVKAYIREQMGIPFKAYHKRGKF